MTQIDRVGEGPGEPGLVSVVIPSYNRAYIVGATIESVLAQSYENFEVIVVDDGSKDNTREVVTRYGPRVRYLYKENAGMAAARNTGLLAARGEFIAYLDSDDFFVPWKLEAQVALLRRHPEVGLVWTDMTAVRGTGEVVHPTFLRTMYSAYEKVCLDDVCRRGGSLGDLAGGLAPELGERPFYVGEIFSHLMLGALVHTSTVLMRRSLLREVEGCDPRYRICEDYEMYVRAARHGPFAMIDAPSLLYRVGDADQMTAPKWILEIARANLQLFEQHVSEARARGGVSEPALARRLADLHGWIGYAATNGGLHAEARRHLLRTLRLRPFQPGAALRLLLSMLSPDAVKGLRRMRRQLVRPIAG